MKSATELESPISFKQLNTKIFFQSYKNGGMLNEIFQLSVAYMGQLPTKSSHK